MKNIIVCIFALVVMGGPAQQGVTSQPASDVAVRLADEAWAKAIASKSVEATVAMYDAEAVTAGSAMFRASGLAALRANWAKMFAVPDFALSWKIDRAVVMASGTMAYTAGTWQMASPSGTGPYLAVWRKQPDGQWKVLIDAAWYGAPAR